MYVHARLFDPIAEIVALRKMGPFSNPITYRSDNPLLVQVGKGWSLQYVP